MTKMKSKKGAWLKALLALPALAILLIVFAANAPSGMSGEDEYLVKGKVVEAASGEALPGVSVIWKGTTWGTVTDMNGEFVLKVKDEDAVVVYSFVGFKTATTKGTGSFTVKMDRKTIRITKPVTLNTTEPMEESGDEYLVKGKVIEASSGEPIPSVNVIWKGHTTGTITDENGDFILKVKDKDAEVIYAMVGFETKSTKGEGNFTVKLKKKPDHKSGTGGKAVIQSDKEGVGEPLYVVDGNIGAELPDPDDIMSITVLKEASAADKYGPSATNGAVVVTTKTGSAKKQKIVDDPSGPKEVFYIVEDMPKFKGNNLNTCIKYVQEHLEYPQEAREKGLNGIVEVFFVVDAKGRVTNAKIKRGVDPLLDKAALKAVNSMPDWTPGKQRGKSVAVQFEIPVEFKL